MSILMPASVRSTSGQALVEVTLIFPMLLTLAFGAVEIGNLIYTYQVIHHLTAQGANIAARLGSNETIENVINKVVDAACPVIGRAGATNCPSPNEPRWRVIYTEMGPDTTSPEPQPYIVTKQRLLGGLGEIETSKRVCKDCGTDDFDCNPGGVCVRRVEPSISRLADVAPGQKFYAFEVFYDYTPITFLGNFVGGTFAGKLYERSIF